VPPLRAVPPNLDLEFSTAQESDDDDGHSNEDQIEVDSPRRSPAARETDMLGHDTKAPSQHDTSSSGSRNGGNGGDNSSSSSDSSSYFVRNADPEAVATELGAKPTAVRLGDNIVKSLRFESRDHERTLLAEAGESFCFPLMEKDLMDTGLKNILENAQDLSLKAFVAARWAARQLEAKSSSKSTVADLEAKVAVLEQEEAALHQRLEKSATERDTLASELLATAERVVKAEDEAKAAKKLAEDAESSREVMRTRLRTFKEAIKTGAEKLQEELPDLLAKYGLVAPQIFPEGTDTVGLESFLKCLRTCVAMVDAGAHFHEDISTVVAVRTLSTAVYGLFPAEVGATAGVTKAQLRSLRDTSFRWLGEEAVHSETLPALAKNIAKNFLDHFFKGEGRAIVRRKVECMKPHVIVYSLYCQSTSLRKPAGDF
jgi:hypothetical protein